MALLHLGDAGGDGVGIGHVELHGWSIAWGRGLVPCRHRGESVGRQAGHTRGTDRSRGTGDQRHPVVRCWSVHGRTLPNRLAMPLWLNAPMTCSAVTQP